MRIFQPAGFLHRCCTSLLLLSGAFAALGVQAQDKGRPEAMPELKLSTAQSPAFPLGKAAARWAELINQMQAATFAIKLYPGATLSGRDPAREFGALKDGPADLAVGSALAWSAQFPAAGVYALPWLSPDAPQQEAVASDRTLFDLVAARAARFDVIVLAVAAAGDRVLATTKNPVRMPAEAGGLKLRVTGVPLAIDTWATLRALPQSLDFAAAQVALAAGSLDGQEALPTALAAQRITATGQRIVTRGGGLSDAMMFAVRKSVWDAWNDAQRQQVRAAAMQAAREAQGPAREDAALAELVKQGVTLVTLAPAQRAVFRAAVQPVWDKWTSAIGPDVVAAAEAAVAAVVVAAPRPVQ